MAFGKRILANTCQRVARSVRTRSRISGSALARPIAVFTTIGKKAMVVPMTMFGQMPYPSHRMKSGASAIFGSVLNSTSTGMMVRIRSRFQTMAMASAMPRIAESTKAPSTA